MRYRPTTTEVLVGAEELPNENSLEWWIEELKNRRRESK